MNDRSYVVSAGRTTVRGRAAGADTAAWFPPAAPSAREARRFVGDRIGCLSPDAVDLVLLMTSELATNAVNHARTEFTVSCRVEDEAVRVEVSDLSARRARVRHPGSDEVSGRGLLLVDALSSRWGIEPTATGKTVWFELDSPFV